MIEYPQLIAHHQRYLFFLLNPDDWQKTVHAAVFQERANQTIDSVFP